MARNFRRYLERTRNRCEFTSDSSRCDSLRTVVKSAFPFEGADFEIVSFRSRDCRSEFHQDGNAILLDDGLRDILKVFGILLRVQPFQPVATHAILHPLFADVCLAQGDAARAAFFSVRGLEELERVVLLWQTAQANEPGHDHERFILLHETAHGVLKNEVPQAVEWREAAEATLEKLAAVSESVMRNGPQSAGFNLLAGARWEDIEPETIKRQMTKFSERLRQGGLLAEEITCDVLALLGYANSNLEAPFILIKESRELNTGEIDKVIISFLQGLRSLKLEQFMASIEQCGKNLCANASPEWLEEHLLVSTARANALVHILCGILAHCGGTRAKGLFTDRVAHLFQQLSVRLLTPLEDLLNLNLNAEHFGPAFEETMARPWGVSPMTTDHQRFLEARNKYPF